MKVNEVLFSLITSSVFGAELNEEQKNSITAENLSAAYDLAVEHSVSHLILPALKQNDLTEICPEVTKKAKKAVYFADITTNIRNDELKKIAGVLSNNNIAFIPLKGAVLADYYPEIWMRTSCDIDVLVKKDDFETAHKLLMSELGYVSKKVMTHDVLLIAESGMHIELHFDLIEENFSAGASKILSEVWSYCKPQAQNSKQYVMSDDMFYFYHIAHMAKHFGEGGCGIRSLLDLYILNKINKNTSKAEELLKKAKLLTFAENSGKLAACWFGGEKYESKILFDMENYIISGKSYGTVQRNAEAYAAKGGKFKKLLTLLFPTYKNMTLLFPVLKKHKILLPLMWIVRWFKAVFEGRGKKSVGRLSAVNGVDKQSVVKTQELLKNLELI